MDAYVPAAIRNLGRLIAINVLIYRLTSFVFSEFKCAAFVKLTSARKHDSSQFLREYLR